MQDHLVPKDEPLATSGKGKTDVCVEHQVLAVARGNECIGGGGRLAGMKQQTLRQLDVGSGWGADIAR